MSQMPSLPYDPEGISAYFTDVESLRDVFQSLVAAPTLPKRLMVIHGVGGVGKSSLLRMFLLHCKHEKVPLAFASGDDAKSALDVLARWTDDCKADGVVFLSSSKTFEHYHAIQAQVDEQARKTSQQDSDRKRLIRLRQILAARFLAARFLTTPDIDLLLDPAKKLADDFLADVAQADTGRARRISFTQN